MIVFAVFTGDAIRYGVDGERDDPPPLQFFRPQLQFLAPQLVPPDADLKTGQTPRRPMALAGSEERAGHGSASVALFMLRLRRKSSAKWRCSLTQE
jgi:hypothetical protein